MNKKDVSNITITELALEVFLYYSAYKMKSGYFISIGQESSKTGPKNIFRVFVGMGSIFLQSIVGTISSSYMQFEMPGTTLTCD